MVRILVVAVALCLATVPIPAFAQKKGASCEQHCREKICVPGNMKFSQSSCMSKCVANCNMKNAK